MNPTSPGVSQVFSLSKPRDLSLLKDPKILSAMVPASQLKIKRESLYLESLYENKLSPLEYGSAVSVSGDLASTLEVGLHIISAGLSKQHWSCVVDPTGKASSLALFEASVNSPRFVCVRNFSQARFAPVMSHLVSSMRVVIAHVVQRVNANQMARLMSRVRENNSIMIFLDPHGLCETSLDRRIVANTIGFDGLNSGSGVLFNRNMQITEYEHGVKISVDTTIAKPSVVNG